MSEPVYESLLLQIGAPAGHVSRHRRQVRHAQAKPGVHVAAVAAAPEEGGQVAGLHQLHDQEVGVVVQTDPNQSHNVGMPAMYVRQFRVRLHYVRDETM